MKSVSTIAEDDKKILISEAWVQALQSWNDGFLWGIIGRTQTSPNWDNGWRTLPDWLIYFPIRNQVLVELLDEIRVIDAGDFFWLEPQTRHRFSNADPAKPAWIYHVRFMWRPPKSLDLSYLDSGYVHWCGMSALEGRFQEFYRESIGESRHREARLRLLFLDLLIEAQRIRDDSARSAGLSRKQRSRVEQAAAAAGWRMPAEALSRTVSLNPDYFRRLFKESYGVPPRTWLLLRRLDGARDLLADSVMRVSEVAEASGFPDVFQFSRAFKKRFGLSPRAFREGS